MNNKRPGILFVVSAPSGAGKTTLCHAMFDKFPDLRQSVSFTTRPMRAGEQDGVDYHFVDHGCFEKMVQAGEFLEWAEVHGHLYGTALSTLQRAATQGADLLLEIDCQGARQIRNSLKDAVCIFVLPPDFSELEHRLRGRETDSDQVIARRLANAKDEISQAHWYDYIVLNDSIEDAGQHFASIIEAERCRTHLWLEFLKHNFALN
ncbi:guanylate kinase [Geopsychrobacter electrodiphilus]|uniref:guanylate kinase n=1 Tax=Geopsychrobacter electrodiphilus TaxID=225196 RepID=UPI000524E2B7